MARKLQWVLRGMQTTIRDLTVPLHAPSTLTENPKKGLIFPNTR